MFAVRNNSHDWNWAPFPSEWLAPGALVPVSVGSVSVCLVEIKRLRAALEEATRPEINEVR